MPKPPRGRPPAGKPHGKPGQKQAEQEFNALFGEPAPDQAKLDAVSVRQVNPQTAQAEARESGEWIEIELLDDSPYQPRLRLSHNKLASLVDSMNAQGQIQAAVARPHPTRRGRYQLAVGHRRKAAVRAGANAGIHKPNPHEFIGKLRVEIVALSDSEMLDRAFAENEEREDFTVFDLAHYYELLREMTPGTVPGKGEAFKPSFEELATLRANMGRPLPHGTRFIRRLVETLTLPRVLQNRLAELNLGESDDKPVPANEKHCRALLLLQPASQKDPETAPNAAQRALMEEIGRERLSGSEALRRAEQRVKAARGETGDGRRETRDEAGSVSRETSGPASWVQPAPPLSTSQPPTAMPASQGTGMATGGTSSRSFQSGAQGFTQADQSDDVAASLLAPAANLLSEAARVLPTLKVTAAYRQLCEDRLAMIARRVAEITEILDEKGVE